MSVRKRPNPVRNEGVERNSLSYPHLGMDPFMRIIIGLFTVLSVGALSQAMATDPPAEAPKAAASAPAPSSTTPATTTTTSTSPTDKTTTTATDGTKTVRLVAGDAAADERLKKLRAAGYKTEMHGKDVVFCRKEPVLGSRFEKKVCSTAEEIDNQMSSGRDMLETTQRTGLGLGNPKGN